MNPTELTCPPPGALADLLANALSAAEADKLRAHITTCPRCQDLLAPKPSHPVSQQPPEWSSSFPIDLDPPQERDEIARLGEYRILGLLGEGGTAYVFDAEDIRLHRPVALKVLKPSTDVTRRKRLIREARAIAALPHDHIVTVYHVNEVRDLVYMALERLHGVSLEMRLLRDRYLPVAEALSIARQVAEGLSVAHAAGLVHRDIKPANIWLEGPGPEGPFTNVKILDFGIARTTVDQGSVTLPGTIVGTPSYMPPEQAQGLVLDHRADLYSLGCVLYRMVAGQPPFASPQSDTLTLLESIIRGDPVPVQELAPQVPAPVATLIRDLLARNPAHRPASAKAVVERIKAIEAGETLPVAATPSLVASITTRPRQRKVGWGTLIGAGVVVIAAVVGVVFGLLNYFSSGGSPDKDDKGGITGGKEPIKVGILHSLTGTLSMNEQPLVEATQFAVDEINKAGGVLGRPLKAIVEDGKSDEDVFADRARKLLEEDEVAVISGCWSSGARKRVKDVCEEKKGLLLFPVDYEGLEQSQSVFYLGGAPNQVLLPMIDYATDELKRKRLFFVGSETVYSKACHAIMKDYLREKEGVSIVGESYTPLGAVNFADLVRQIKTSKADMILNTLDGQSLLGFAQAVRSKEANIDPDKVPSVWFNMTEHELRYVKSDQMLGDYTAWCYFESVDRKKNKDFIARYRARFGETRRLNDPMQTAYIGIYLWKQAVEQAGSLEISAVRSALRKQEIDAPGGLLHIDPPTQNAWRFSRIGQIGTDQTIKIVKASEKALPPRPWPPSRTKEEWRTFLDDLYKGWGNRWEKHAE